MFGDIPLRTIKLFSVLFSGVWVHAASRDKQTFGGASPTVRSRPTLHGHRQLFLSLCNSHVQQLIDSQWCMADCVIYTASSSVNVFDNSHVQQSSIASYYTRIAIYTPPAFDASVRGFPSEYRRPIWYGKTRMAWLPEGEKISKIRLLWPTIYYMAGHNVTMRQRGSAA